MKIKSLTRTLILALVLALLLTGLFACGGKAKNFEDPVKALEAKGEALVQLTGTYSLDLTGLEVRGRTRIMVDQARVRLTGLYRPGPGTLISFHWAGEDRKSEVDLSSLTFDLEGLGQDLEEDFFLLELEPGMAFLPPALRDGIKILDFPNSKVCLIYRPSTGK